MENYSLADIAAASGNEGFGGGMGYFWIFALLLLAGGNFGFNNGNNGDLQRAIDLNSIQNGQRDIEARVQEIGAENISAIKDNAYANLSEIRDLQSAVTQGFANQQNCCCEVKSAIMENRYLDAQNTSAITTAVHAEGEATRNLIQQNKIEALQNRLNTVEMQQAIGQATAGVVKYPMQTTYSSGVNPFCSCNCGNI